MALQSSGVISIGDVASEFGDTHPSSLSEFRGKGNAPASGPVSLSDFYGASDAYIMEFMLNLDNVNRSYSFDQWIGLTAGQHGSSQTLTTDSPINMYKFQIAYGWDDDKTNPNSISIGLEGIPNATDLRPLGHTVQMLDILLNGISLMDNGLTYTSKSVSRPIELSDLAFPFEKHASQNWVAAGKQAYGFTPPQLVCDAWADSVVQELDHVLLTFKTAERPSW